MIHASFSLREDVEASLEARMHRRGYARLADYLQALIEADADVEEASSDISAALDEGERSGTSDRSLDQIFAEARARYAAEQT